jgi:hypothetical protein
MAGEFMRSLVSVVGFCLLSLAAGHAHGQAGTELGKPAKPKVYALVAAVGAQFNLVHQKIRTGSHLPPYERSTADARNNILNRIVLESLDKEIANIDPGSTRIYMSLAAARLDGVAPLERDRAAIGKIVSVMEKVPERLEWDRLVIVTPAYAAFERNGMAAKLQGLGMYTQPLRGSRLDLSGAPWDWAFNSGEDVVTPSGEETKSTTYLAPYSYITVWILDPKTLAVLDKQERFDNQKLADPRSESIDMNQSVKKEYLAGRIVNVIGKSVHEGIMATELGGRRGEVEVRDVGVVKPDEARK